MTTSFNVKRKYDMIEPIRGLSASSIENALDTEGGATSPRAANTAIHHRPATPSANSTMARLRALALLSIHFAVAFDVRQTPTTRFRQRLSFLVQSDVPEAQHEDRVEESPRIRSPSTNDASVEEEKQGECLPPVIQSLVDERREYQLNLGRAMDTLRSDMQDILSKTPDFSIYHKDLKLVDPSGVQLNGLEKYKSGFAFFQTFVSFWFHTRCSIQFRMLYDSCRSTIRISWNAVLVPKIPLGRPLHVDGISYYRMDVSGKIIEHRIENLLINNSPVAPPYGILSLLQQDALRLSQPQGSPAGVGALMREQPFA